MDCSAIQELLSEYIDGVLDVKAKKAVEKHVSTCESCNQELASLSAVVEELGSLDQVKAPADFLEKIHERMEPRFSIDRLIRKLFVPFHIKQNSSFAIASDSTQAATFRVCGSREYCLRNNWG